MGSIITSENSIEYATWCLVLLASVQLGAAFFIARQAQKFNRRDSQNNLSYVYAINLHTGTNAIDRFGIKFGLKNSGTTPSVLVHWLWGYDFIDKESSTFEVSLTASEVGSSIDVVLGPETSRISDPLYVEFEKMEKHKDCFLVTYEIIVFKDSLGKIRGSSEKSVGKSGYKTRL